MSTTVVTGANRGIGLEFARQLSARGGAVVGTARRPTEAEALRALGVRVEPLDVADDASVAAFAKRLAGDPVDALINNAGIGESGPRIAALPIAGAERALQVNALGALRVTQALLPNLRHGARRLVVGLSSGLSSLERNREGGWAAYRVSKAALNMIFRTLAAELAAEGFTCVVIDPGWVRTDMGGRGAPTPPEASVAAMLKTLDRLTPADSGRFLSARGKDAAW